MRKIQVYILLAAFIVAIQSCKKDQKITKSDPEITWNNPADIIFGTLLSATQLNATADVPGVFVYSPPIGTKLEVGSNQDLSAVFTPSDASAYNTATKTVKINVTATKGNPVITWNNPSDISFGTLLSATQLNATTDVPGVFVYSPPIGTKLEVGSNQDLSAVFTPTDAATYNTATKTVKINVIKANPVITWNNPADIASGTLLSATLLNATADVPGVFVYSPPIGTKLDIGSNQELSVVFTPTDAASYNTATKTVHINVTAFAPLHDPVFSLSINDSPYNHNMHIASDGSFYYTCNGGDYLKGKINKYTLEGVYVTSYDIKIDMRSIMYNKVDKSFYVSGFESLTTQGNIYKITNMATGAFTNLLPNLYDNAQSGTAFSDDCQYIYAFNAGTLKKYKLSDGSLAGTITGLNFGTTNGSDAVVAVDMDYIYTWDAASKTVYVYDLTGKFVRNLNLPQGSWGYSLSFVDGLLFVAVDAAYATGTWYGYNIRKPD